MRAGPVGFKLSLTGVARRGWLSLGRQWVALLPAPHPAARLASQPQLRVLDVALAVGFGSVFLKSNDCFVHSTTPAGNSATTGTVAGRGSLRIIAKAMERGLIPAALAVQTA